ncbi:MAG: lysine--tRNA ligase [Defluviicoccus sp.]|nr:lysine--tRNA ligase [Defluviicoccus sp.]MDE0385894.1 lysine--tRNA ligase [Defluviicoccus sp.]
MSGKTPADEPRSWPFEEARKVLKRTGGAVPETGHVLFATGYGPSGLPHIGTFGEVVRTQMVRRALAELSDLPSRLFAFSDDMDGLRKVPDNIPNADMVARHLGQPLTAIPDPFGTHESFGHHNNARLRSFLDRFGFDYAFKSATECYRSGVFDSTLLAILADYERITNVILPTLGPERRATYSPFLPICPDTGRVLQAPVVACDVDAGTIAYRAVDGRSVEVPVTGGHCKLQWKADWAMRWVALGVDYEMSGKDLIDSVRLSGQICRLLGARPPEGFTYELFLDEAGEKISKSRGNGLSVEEWLTYAPTESLALFMYNSPRKAKRLYFDVIPRQVDDYLGWLEKFAAQNGAERRDNPAWHIHAGDPPEAEGHVGFGLLLNLASACNAEDSAMLWGFITRYAPTATPASAPILDRLVGHALAYYRDFVKPAKRYRPATDEERAAIAELADALEALPPGADAETVQNEVYAVGKRHDFASLRDWFRALYEVLLGQSQGPRFGSFVALYGIAETVALMRRAQTGEPIAAE